MSIFTFIHLLETRISKQGKGGILYIDLPKHYPAEYTPSYLLAIRFSK